MSRFGELYPGIGRDIADATRPVIDDAAVAAENAAYAASKMATAARIAEERGNVAATVKVMAEAVRTINYVLTVLRSEGLDISEAYSLEIRNLRSKGGDFVACTASGQIAKRLAASAVEIYRDSADTNEMGDKVAEIFGLLE